MNKKITIIVIIIVAIFILVGLIRQISSALDDGSRLDEAADKVNTLQNENRKLKESLTEAKSLDSIEETSRNDLNMARSDETIVVIPTELLDQVIESQKPPAPEPKLPNWQGWLKLFLH